MPRTGVSGQTPQRKMRIQTRNLRQRWTMRSKVNTRALEMQEGDETMVKPWGGGVSPYAPSTDIVGHPQK